MTDLIDEPLTVKDVEYVLHALTHEQLHNWTVPVAKMFRHLDRMREGMATHTYTETLEESYLRKLEEAMVAAAKVKNANPTRDNSVSITNLETARLWAKLDMEKKLGRA